MKTRVHASGSKQHGAQAGVYCHLADTFRTVEGALHVALSCEIKMEMNILVQMYSTRFTVSPIFFSGGGAGIGLFEVVACFSRHKSLHQGNQGQGKSIVSTQVSSLNHISGEIHAQTRSRSIFLLS